jgi:hypothetical protein
MSSPDHETDATLKWREGLPDSWDKCTAHPPLPPRASVEIEVVTQATATVFQLQDSGTYWMQADNDDVLTPDEYR